MIPYCRDGAAAQQESSCIHLAFLSSCCRAAHFPTLNSFSWAKSSISAGILGHFRDSIEIPAKRLGFPRTVLVPGKDEALEKPCSDLYEGKGLLGAIKTGKGNYSFGN